MCFQNWMLQVLFSVVTGCVFNQFIAQENKFSIRTSKRGEQKLHRTSSSMCTSNGELMLLFFFLIQNLKTHKRLKHTVCFKMPTIFECFWKTCSPWLGREDSANNLTKGRLGSLNTCCFCGRRGKCALTGWMQSAAADILYLRTPGTVKMRDFFFFLKTNTIF